MLCLQVPTSCPGVPAVLLQPALQWADKADFNDTLTQLAGLFVTNFKVCHVCLFLCIRQRLLMVKTCR